MAEDHGLSSRELEILELIATGVSNKEIAEALSISSNTVKVHLKNIYSKIGVSSRTEAALYAVRNDLFTQAGPEDAAARGEAQPTWNNLRANSAQAHTRQLQTSKYWNITLAAVGIALLAIVGMFVIFQLDRPENSPDEILDIGPPSERLQIRDEMPSPRSGFAIVSHQNRIFTIGGKGESGITGKVERFDPRLDEWIELPPKPIPAVDIQAAVIGGLIYVPGGFVEGSEPTNVLEVFDPQLGVWEQGSEMPVPLSAYAMTEYEGKLYLFGGWDGEKYSDIALSYDPQVDEWTQLTSMPTPRGYAAGVEAGGTLFIVGGYEGTEPLSIVEGYNPLLEMGGENPWKRLEPLPDPRYGMGVANVADIIHIIGGVGLQKDLTSYKYVPQINEWQVFDFPATEGWSNLGVVQIETDLFVLGGLLDGKPTARNVEFQVMFSVLLPVVQ